MKSKTSLCLLATALVGPACPAGTVFSWETGTEGWTAGAGASITTAATGATDGVQALSITSPMANMWYATPTQIELDQTTRQALFTGATEIKLDVSYPNPGYNSWTSTPSVELIIQGAGVPWTPLGFRDLTVNGAPQTFTWALTAGQASALASANWAQLILKFTYGNGGSTGTNAVFYVDNLQSTGVIVEPPVADFFWKGDVSASWADLNWTSDPEGTVAAGALTNDGSDGIAFAAIDAANLFTSLDADRNVKGMIFLAGTGSVTIGGTDDLTVGAEGILAEATAGQVVIDTTGQVILSANQLWTNNSGSTLIVDSPVSGAFKLTTGGSGTTLLTAANSHAGGTTVQQGKLVLGNTLALGPATTTLTAEGGVVDLNGYSPTLGGIAGTISGIIRNDAFDPVTLTVDDDTGSTMGAPINDGLGTVSLVKAGSGTLVMDGQGNFSGNVLVSEGQLTANSAVWGVPTGSNFGSAQTAGKTITVASGASVLFNSIHVLGNQQADVALLPTFILNGSTLDSTRYSMIGGLTLNGGTLTQTSTDAGNNQGYQFKGPVDVIGSAPSFIASMNGKGNHLSADTVFTVADVTGNADPDIVVTNPLINQSGDFGNAPGGLTKDGPGTLVLEGINSYTGGTKVLGGTLSLTTATLGDSSVVEIDTDGILDLAHFDVDRIGVIKIGGTIQLSGTHGAIGSGADHESPRISGSGLLEILPDPFFGWMANFPSLTGGDAGKEADPDFDGITNLEEFALDGDPTSGAASEKVRSRLETVGADQVLVITLPVRDGAAFTGNAPATATVAADGVRYEIAGSNDLSLFNQNVSEVVPASTANPSLPGLTPGWTYRTFRLDGVIGGATPRGPQGFLRAEFKPAP